MKFSDTEIRKRLRLGRDETWEFKQVEFKGNHLAYPSQKVLADEMAAFANANGGVILFGVTDQGRIQGMNFDQLASLNLLLVTVAKDTIKPAINIKVYHREIDGKAYILTVVLKGFTVHGREGNSYIRVGTTKRNLEEDERLSLAQFREQNRFLNYDLQIVPNTGFKTFNPKLWEPLISAANAYDPHQGLMNLRLLAVDKAGIIRATVAGILLCTEEPNEWLP